MNNDFAKAIAEIEEMDRYEMLRERAEMDAEVAAWEAEMKFLDSLDNYPELD